MNGLFGKLSGNHPLFFLAVYAPAIAAVIIITYTNGLSGLRAFLTRALLWRCSKAWYAFILIVIPMVFYAGSALKGNLFSEPFPFTSLNILAIALLLAAIKGPVEEFGWRGLALPLPAAQNGAVLGRTSDWHCLGVLAYTGVSFEWYSAEPVVIHSVFCRLYSSQYYRNPIIQRVRG